MYIYIHTMYVTLGFIFQGVSWIVWYASSCSPHVNSNTTNYTKTSNPNVLMFPTPMIPMDSKVWEQPNNVKNDSNLRRSVVHWIEPNVS